MDTLFYGLCECNAIEEILEYNGSIHQLKRWGCQELLAYEFVIIHCLAAMMQDVDSISRYLDPLVHQYTITASRLHIKDVTIRLFAYSFDFLFVAIIHAMLPLLMHSLSSLPNHQFLKFLLSIITQ